ncbi:hypothetical protein ACLOJK_001066 [Asimina triloba]
MRGLPFTEGNAGNLRYIQENLPTVGILGTMAGEVDAMEKLWQNWELVGNVDSPSHSFRSYSVSSSDNEGRCTTIVNCLARKVSIPPEAAHNVMTSKVTPQPTMGNGQGIGGAPRLVRSHAVRRDLVRDWNFDEVLVGG